MRAGHGKDLRQRIAEAVRNGMLPGDAARDFGVSVPTVYCSCREFGVATSLARKVGYTKANRVIKLWFAGESVPDIAKKASVPIAAVTGICKGISRQRPIAKTGQPIAYLVIATLCNTPLPFSEIARQFHVSRQAVYGVYVRARDAGIPVRPRGKDAGEGGEHTRASD